MSQARSDYNVNVNITATDKTSGPAKEAAKGLGGLEKAFKAVAASAIVKQVVQNSVLADALGSVRDSVGKGEAIANAIKKTGLFPPIVYHIIATGQVGGNLEEGLMDVADMYDNEVELATKTLTSLLEPVVLLCMGAVVGFIVLAVLLPIFDINQML